MRLNLRFKPGLRMTLFVLVFLPLTVSLGLWQLERAQEKRDMQTSYLSQLTMLPVAPSAELEMRDFMRLRLRGYLREEVFLVDNQVLARQAGYWVVQVLEQHDGQRWLVNRGYTQAPESRAELPDIQPVAEAVDVVGIVWPDTGLVPLLAGDPWSGNWPERVQRLNVTRMAEVTEARPFEIRLEQSALAMQPAPFVTVLSEDKHLGYAATWFGLAIALLALYIYSGIPRREKL